jgi:hypothetical protein
MGHWPGASVMGGGAGRKKEKRALTPFPQKIDQFVLQYN